MTFSTLLSSQGAGAHRIKGLSAGHRGNSLTLPVDLHPVKRSRVRISRFPHTDTVRTETSGGRWWRWESPRDRPPRSVSVPPGPAIVENPTEINRSKSNRFPGAGRGRSSQLGRRANPSQWDSRALGGSHDHDASEPGSATSAPTRRPPGTFPATCSKSGSSVHLARGRPQLSEAPAPRRCCASRAAGRPTAQTAGPARRWSPRDR